MSIHKEEVQRQLEALVLEYDRVSTLKERMDNGEIGSRAKHQSYSLQLESLRKQIEGMELQLSRIRDEEKAAQASVAAGIEQAKREDRTFWFRRFHTSLAIAHGAGFAAVASNLLDPAATASTATAALIPMAAFAVGMVLAGLIPVALYRDAARWAWSLAGISAALFCAALVAAVIAVGVKAELKLPVREPAPIVSPTKAPPPLRAG